MFYTVFVFRSNTLVIKRTVYSLVVVVVVVVVVVIVVVVVVVIVVVVALFIRTSR